MSDREYPEDERSGSSERAQASDAAATPTPGGPVSPHPVPRGAGGMNVVRWVLLGGMLLLAGISIASYVAWRIQNGRPGVTAHAARYYCPMHPTYTSDRKGECPICGMDLEPIPTTAASDSSFARAGDVPGLAPVHLTPERVQMIGVRYARVERRALDGGLELVGFIEPDETGIRRVQLRVSGWVQNLAVNRTGQLVHAGEPLLTIYSPELYQTESEYLIETGGPAPGAEAGAGAPHAPSAHEDRAAASSAARRRLELMGVPAEEIARLGRDRTAATRLVLRSPATGTVLERQVVEGQYVTADVPLMTLAELSRVWVLADLYEMDLGRIHVGASASFTADALPTRHYAGRVEFVSPTVDNQTRTVKVRVPVANPDGALRPGMYGRVRVLGRGAATLVVPSEAVIQAGTHDYVFLARNGGHFEPRLVHPGAQIGAFLQILSGVAEGDTVVASASFLVDSESRLEAAISGMGAGAPPAHQHPGSAP